jgi:hypothetical protein
LALTFPSSSLFVSDILNFITTISSNVDVDNNCINVNNNLIVITIPYAKYCTINYETQSKNALFIFEDQWWQHKAILSNRIQSLLGCNATVKARYCNCVEIEPYLATKFLRNNHLMGGVSTPFYYGLIHQNQIIAVAAFSHGRVMRRLANGLLSYELVAYASELETNVAGGLSKIIHKFVNDKKPGDIMTYTDATFTNSVNNVFVNLGFEYHSNSDCLHFAINTKKHSRRKLKNLQAMLLPHEIIHTNNGNAKFVLTSSNLW